MEHVTEVCKAIGFLSSHALFWPLYSQTEKVLFLIREEKQSGNSAASLSSQNVCSLTAYGNGI